MWYGIYVTYTDTDTDTDLAAATYAALAAADHRDLTALADTYTATAAAHPVKSLAHVSANVMANTLRRMSRRAYDVMWYNMYPGVGADRPDVALAAYLALPDATRTAVADRYAHAAATALHDLADHFTSTRGITPPAVSAAVRVAWTDAHLTRYLAPRDPDVGWWADTDLARTLPNP